MDMSDRPVSARLLRKIPVPQLAKLARRLPIMQMLEWSDDKFRAVFGDLTESERRLIEEQARPPGQAGHPPSYYARLAVEYEEWIATGRPFRGLAERLSFSEAGLRTALAKARREGLLTRTARGKAGGGVATKKAWEILRKDGQGETNGEH